MDHEGTMSCIGPWGQELPVQGRVKEYRPGRSAFSFQEKGPPKTSSGREVYHEILHWLESFELTGTLAGAVHHKTVLEVHDRALQSPVRPVQTVVLLASCQ